MLTDLDLAVPPGRTGLVGRNGSGRSTLLALPVSSHDERILDRPGLDRVLDLGAVDGVRVR